MRVKLNLDVFEQCRPKRRSRSKLRLSRRTREKLLLNHGVSQALISKATVETMLSRMSSLDVDIPPVENTNAIPTASSLVEEFEW